jgi:hypothetical protein
MISRYRRTRGLPIHPKAMPVILTTTKSGRVDAGAMG